jgi:hypothetical protein
MRKAKTRRVEFVSGWKDIANYLGKGVRTVQRYERELGLPIRRPSGRDSGSVIATKVELDAWIAASPIRETFRLPGYDSQSVPARLDEFKRQIAEMHRLRQETEGLRYAVRSALEQLRANLQVAFPDTLKGGRNPSPLLSDPERHMLADVLSFEAPKKKVH